MAIDLEQLVLMAREHLTDLPEAVQISRESLFALIKPAIALWQEETARDPAKRQSFIVESDNITVTAGVADLTSQVDAKGFRLDWLTESDIEVTYANGQTPPYTVKFVTSLDRLKMPARQDKFFYLAYLSGKKLRFKEPEMEAVDTMNGTIKIRGAVIPSDPSTLDAAVMPQLATALANLARGQMAEQNRGLDIPR